MQARMGGMDTGLDLQEVDRTNPLCVGSAEDAVTQQIFVAQLGLHRLQTRPGLLKRCIVVLRIQRVVGRDIVRDVDDVSLLVVGVMTITFGLLEGIPTIFLIGCTGVLLIAFGIGALLMREKVSDLRERLDDWNA